MTQFNSELADRIIGQIEAHPETWDQRNWISENECGTVFCVAGWAMELTRRDRGLDTIHELMHAEGRAYDYMGTAARLLGLNIGQANELFIESIGADESVHGDGFRRPINTPLVLDHVKGLMKKYANGEE